MDQPNVALASFLFYVVLPASLVTAVIFRYNFIGVIYLILLISWPFNAGIRRSYSKRFSLVVLIFSAFFNLITLVFQTVVFSTSILQTESTCDDPKFRIMRFMGLQPLRTVVQQADETGGTTEVISFADVIDWFRILLPDIVVFVVSLVCYLTLRKIRQKNHSGSQETQLIHSSSSAGGCQTETFLTSCNESQTESELLYFERLNFGLFTASLVFLGLAGIASPSLLSLPYLLLFLSLMTFYSFHMELEPMRLIYKLRLCISVYTACHLVLIYIYQLQIFNQEWLEPTNLAARLAGLKQLVIITCQNPFNVSIALPPHKAVIENGTITEVTCKLWEGENCKGTEWPAFVEPVFILFLHFCCAFTYKVFNQLIEAQKRRYITQQGPEDPFLSELDDRSSDTYPANISTHSPLSVAAFNHRISIFAARLPPKKHIITALREKALYVFGLIMMMAWSVTYHSWITFILLLWSCYLWMARNRDQVTLKHAKWITLYAIVLILLQFVYSLNLYSNSELPAKLSNELSNEDDTLKTFGLRRPESHAFYTLFFMITFTLVFWLMIHEHIRQKYNRNSLPEQSPKMPKLQTWILEQLARYFIIIVSAFLLFISLSGDVVGYKIIYMVFFLSSAILFQLSWNIWHRILRVFWLLLVVYSILVVVLTYTFQLNNFLDYWEKITGLNKEALESLGLKKYDDGSDLMVKIFMPTAFLVCCMLQLHYYHERFVILTEVDGKIEDSTDQTLPATADTNRETRERRPTGQDESDQQYHRRELLYHIWRKLCDLTDMLRRILWKLLEIHRWKICAVTVILSALFQPSACYLFPVIIWILGLPFRSLDHFIYIVTLLWASVVLLLSMVYQLKFVNDKIQDMIYPPRTNLTGYKNCSEIWDCKNMTDCRENVNAWALFGEDYEEVDVLIWFGFQKIDESFCANVRGWLAIIITLLAERVIFRRSRYLENMYPETKKAPGAIFPHITQTALNTNVKECMMFFANYFFHKFGCEICFVSTVITVWIRQDFWGGFYAVFLLILMIISFQSRTHLKRVWKTYTMMLSIIWAIQYIFILGLPPALCRDYNWSQILPKIIPSLENQSEMLQRFILFMFLPEHPQYQNAQSALVAAERAKRLIPDFFQLLLAVCQCAVFANEEREEWKNLAGSNEDHPLDKVTENPYPNFILAEPPTTLDRLKTFVFSMIYWVTFTVVLIAGTNRTSAFCLGYLVAAFYFLYQGQVIITSMPSLLRRRWNCLLFFAAAVIVVKCCLQYVACVVTVSEDENEVTFTSVIKDLLSLTCERCDDYYKDSDGLSQCKEKMASSGSFNTVGIVWDFATFVFLLIQRRIFQSYYFLHVRADLIVQMALSSKGNQLFSLWIDQESKKRHKAEQDDKVRVEETIERIKSNLRKDLREPYDHFDALRVCDKSWFEDMSEDIYAQPRETNSSQIGTVKDGLPARAQSEGDRLDEHPGIEPIGAGISHIELTHSHTIESLNKQDQSPKLPESVRNFKNTIGNVLFTGRIGNTTSEQLLHESRETLNEPVISEQPGQSVQPTQATGGPGIQQNVEEDDIGIGGPPPRPGCGECMVNLGIDLLIYLTRVLNTRTQAYRSIIIQLKKDRQQPWMDKLQPSGSDNNIFQKFVPERNIADKIKKEALRHSLHPEPANLSHINRKRSLQEGEDGYEVGQSSSSSENEIQNDDISFPEHVKFISPDDFDKGEHYVQRLLSAIWYFGQFQIENVCYLLMLFNGMLNASLLSLPFLSFIFLWAMLSVPRPSKRFWVTAICYTCFVIFIKYIFSFSSWPWIRQEDQNIGQPFWLPRITGIERKAHLKYLDIGQLLVLFFQRGLLKVHGLWENYDEQLTVDDEDFPVPILDKSIRIVKNFGNQIGLGNHESQRSHSRLAKDSALKQFLGLLRSPGRFYARLVEQEKDRKNTPTDVYIWMLGVDFICFIIIMFGYWAFGKHSENNSGDITVEIKENVVPTSFLYLLFTHFFLILIDRAIYLKKNLVAKLVFHVMQVIAIHIWMFFFLPFITEIPFYENHVAVALYTFKALYFAFSSHQIKCGYPTRILQHFLTKKFNYVNLYIFIAYRICPFIIEFQNIMDWMFVESTMGISRWFMLTTCYHELYQIKCWRILEKQFHYPRGAPRWPSFKYSGGGFLLILLILIMWFPLAFMSIVQTVAGVPNLPKELSVKVTINGYETLYSSSAFKNPSLQDWGSRSDRHYAGDLSLEGLFSDDLGAQQYISRYEAIDLSSAAVSDSSKSLWMISPPELKKLINVLSDEQPTVVLTLDYSVRRSEGRYETASGSIERPLDASEVQSLKEHIQNKTQAYSNFTSNPVTIKNIFPQYIRALTTNEARNEELGNCPNLDITMEMTREDPDMIYTNQQYYYWKLNTTLDRCYKDLPDYYRDSKDKILTKEEQEYISKQQKDRESMFDDREILIFSDRKGPDSLSWLTGYGVIGLYLSVTLLCGRYTRAIFQYDGAYILFHEYPNVDALLQLCLDIYLVREMKLWKLEEDLMAKLIYLYRSPETMLPFTKLRPHKPKHKTLKQE